jgi:hypothetical protein
MDDRIDESMIDIDVLMIEIDETMIDTKAINGWMIERLDQSMIRINDWMG